LDGAVEHWQRFEEVSLVLAGLEANPCALHVITSMDLLPL
jgi:hypothetical protein